jgi:hypothetical protein
MRRLLALACLPVTAALAFACAAAAVTVVGPGDGGEGGVLFVGNSLTEANDLPARVAEAAAAAGHPLRTSGVTLSGASLDDHWQDGRALRAIRKGRWSVVALQQGPSTLPESRAALIASTRQFAEEIRRAGGRPALLMVWPLPGQTAAAVSASYRAAAEATDAILLPAGDAWTIAATHDPSLVLTQADGYHPSPLGTWLAALAVECTLFPQDAPALPSAVPGGGLRLDAARRALLADAGCQAGSPSAAGR